MVKSKVQSFPLDLAVFNKGDVDMITIPQVFLYSQSLHMLDVSKILALL